MTRYKTTAYPAIKTLAAKTGLNEKTVRLALDDACRQGWITRRSRKEANQAWRNYEYASIIPGSLTQEAAGAAPAAWAQDGTNETPPAGDASQGVGMDTLTSGHTIQNVRAQDPIKNPRSIHLSNKEDAPATPAASASRNAFQREKTGEEIEQTRQATMRKIQELGVELKSPVRDS